MAAVVVVVVGPQSLRLNQRTGVDGLTWVFNYPPKQTGSFFTWRVYCFLRVRRQDQRRNSGVALEHIAILKETPSLLMDYGTQLPSCPPFFSPSLQAALPPFFPSFQPSYPPFFSPSLQAALLSFLPSSPPALPSSLLTSFLPSSPPFSPSFPAALPSFLPSF